MKARSDYNNVLTVKWFNQDLQILVCEALSAFHLHTGLQVQWWLMKSTQTYTEAIIGRYSTRRTSRQHNKNTTRKSRSRRM